MQLPIANFYIQIFRNFCTRYIYKESPISIIIFYLREIVYGMTLNSILRADFQHCDTKFNKTTLNRKKVNDKIK